MTSNPNFDERRFKGQVDAALKRIKTVLENTRNPQYPADVPHRYDDKYYMIEALSSCAGAAHLVVFQKLGLKPEDLRSVLQWADSRTVTFRFDCTESCVWDHKEKRKVESPTLVTETKIAGIAFTSKDKVETVVKEYWWKFTASWRLTAYRGNVPSDSVLLQERTGSVLIKGGRRKFSPPRSGHTIAPKDVTVTWLLNRIDPKTNAVHFNIDRSKKSCRTPRRNSDVESAMSYFQGFSYWANDVYRYITSSLFGAQQDHGLDISKISDSDIFVPVVPLFEEAETRSVGLLESGKGDTTTTTTTSSSTALVNRVGDAKVPVLSPDDVTEFIKEQRRSLDERFEEFDKMFPDDKKLITFYEATFLTLLLHAQRITTHFLDGVEYVEDMLYKQLTAAIGKEVTPVDFANYMVFHNRKLFKAEYEPKCFSYAIRLPDHYPEGTVGIDIQQPDGSAAEPIQTIVRWSPALRPMSFNIEAATNISFYGDRYLHAFVQHKFSGQVDPQLNLVARARQFSSFILVLGKVISGDRFDAEAAIIIQNKDDLKIPLLLQTVPTQAEFDAAVESLSPEQQRFVAAYRSFQLSNTLFGFLVLQIKPQLEKLLKLPTDCLQKEIKLTQELLDLFITYQIPSDLISYDGDPSASNASKIAEVKKHVVAMQEMIKLSKEQELQEAQQSRDYYKAGGHVAGVVTGVRQQLRFPRRQVHTGSGGAVVQQQAHLEARRQAEEEDSRADLTLAPKQLRERFAKLDKESALRPTALAANTPWTRKHTESLLSSPVDQVLYNAEQDQERDKAYDLLDALSCAGCLPFDHAELHVILAATHCFDATLINTVIQRNINPIEKVECSTLIVATTVHGLEAKDIIKGDQVERVQTYSPILFSSKDLLEHNK